MNRRNLQQLAEDRIEDARALLAAGRWSGAYYVAGYSLECGLKACVLRYVENTGIIFQDRDYAKRCWTHDLQTLFDAADLGQRLESAVQTNTLLGLNWKIAKEWSQLTRYDLSKTELDGIRLIKAIGDSTDGVLSWLRNYW